MDDEQACGLADRQRPHCETEAGVPDWRLGCLLFVHCGRPQDRGVNDRNQAKGEAPEFHSDGAVPCAPATAAALRAWREGGAAGAAPPTTLELPAHRPGPERRRVDVHVELLRIADDLADEIPLSADAADRQLAGR